MNSDKPGAQDGDEAGPRAAPTTDGISEKVERLFELVPEIGTRWRWYDIPYRFFDWFLRSLPQRFVPYQLRRLLMSGMNFVMAFEHLERTRAELLDDPMDNLIVPDEEAIRQGGLWVMELFAPSHYADLERSLRRNGWDSEHRVMLHGTNAEQVRRAREGRGFSWSRLGAVARPGGRFFGPDAKRESLPAEFDFVSLSALQVGTSVTAIVAHFGLSDTGESALDEVWHAAHEPRLQWRGLRRPHVLNRHFAAIEATQLERQRIHDLGRQWLAKRCRGFFSMTEAGQPVVDLNVFNSFDPTSDAMDRMLSDSLRALGMDNLWVDNYVSDEIRGAVLVPTEDSWDSASSPLRNCWAVVGSHERLSELNDRSGYGDRPYSSSALATMFDHAIQSFMLHISIMRYIQEVRAQQSRLRDEARTRHGRFSPGRLRRLRNEVLATSLDLPTVARDTASLWAQRGRYRNGIDVRAVPAPGAPDPRPEEHDLIEILGERRKAAFEELLADDKTYRTVLSTAASLGSSADATRTGRLALTVAAVSLFVAVVSLLSTQPGYDFLRSTFGL